MQVSDESKGAWVKLEIFIPSTHLMDLEEALHRAGAGVIGNYDHCFAVSEVRGSFRPREGADPFAGEVGEFYRGVESKLEVNCPTEQLKVALAAIRKVHPYEEPVINIIPLASPALEEPDGD
jgi:hypothetical protein